MSSCARSRGRGSVTRCSALTGAVSTAAALTLLLSGCAVGSSHVEGASPEPRADLAQKAEVAAGNQPQARTTATAGWAGLVALDDPSADHGNGPGYGDITAVRFSESDEDLAVSVTTAAVIPGVLADRELEGVGVDLFRSGSDESDYQLFLDGGTHGWRAFLQTPDGFVAFPGTFAVHGRTFAVVVPWAAVGGRESAEVSAFVDWSSGVGRLSTDGTPRVELLDE